MGSGRNGPALPLVPFAGWFRHPAPMDAETVLRCLLAAEVSPGDMVIDACAGAGSTIAAATARGLRGVGLEALSLTADLAALKFTPLQDTAGLRRDAELLAGRLRPASTSAEDPFVKRCFHTDVLQLLVALRDSSAELSSPWRDHLRLAVVASLADHACADVSWAYPQPDRTRTPKSADPATHFLRRVHSMADELDAHPRAWRRLGSVHHRDARHGWAWRGLVDEHAADAAVVSPAYFNNYDYVDGARLELLFAAPPGRRGEILRSERAGLVAASTQHATERAALAANRDLARWPRTAGACRALSGALRHKRFARAHGKPYDLVLPMYLRDMGLILTGLRRVLRPGAAAAFVVGDSAPYDVPVDTPALLARLAGEVGFIVEGTDQLRARGPRWLLAPGREARALHEWLVLLRVPDGHSAGIEMTSASWRLSSGTRSATRAARSESASSR